MNLDEIQQLAERARQRGMDPLERLDTLGLLLTDERRVKLTRQVCEALAERIWQEPIRNLLNGRPPVLLADVKQGIVEYIRRNFVKESGKFSRGEGLQ